MENPPFESMYFLFKMGIFQPANVCLPEGNLIRFFFRGSFLKKIIHSHGFSVSSQCPVLPKGQASDSTMVFYDSVTGWAKLAGWGGVYVKMKENTPMDQWTKRMGLWDPFPSDLSGL